MSPASEPEHLRVLVANQRPARLDHVTTIVVSLGHEVIARSIEVTEVAAVTSRERPDVALVGLGDSSDHALELIASRLYDDGPAASDAAAAAFDELGEAIRVR